MGYSFVLFDVSLVISRGYFHCVFIGHTQNMYSPWAKSYFPVGKSSSGTATNQDNTGSGLHQGGSSQPLGEPSKWHGLTFV